MSDNVVVVVGVGGMGEVIARQLGAGAHVVLADFSQAALDRVTAALQADGIEATAHLVDVTSHESVTILARTLRRSGRSPRSRGRLGCRRRRRRSPRS